MMKFLSLLGASSLAVCCMSHDHSDEYTVEELTLNFVSESIEWDSTNDLYYMANFSNGTLFYYDASDIDAFLDGTASGGAFSGYTFTTPAGMYNDGTSLYVNDLVVSTIAKFDISTKEYDSVLATVYFDTSQTIAAYVNGMCVDPTDTDYLYVTDAGLDPSTGFATNTEYGMIYKVKISDGTYSKIYNASSNSGGFIYPNGCIFDSDGTLYAVEVNRNSTQNRLIIYDGTTWSFESAPSAGDGLEIDNDGNLYYSTWEYYNATDDETGGIYKIEIDGSDYTFELVATGMTSPADIGYNSDDNYILVPSLTETTLYAIDLDESIAFNLKTISFTSFVLVMFVTFNTLFEM